MIGWCDLETTGLDVKKESILEAAFVITDDNLNEMGRFRVVMKPVGGLKREAMDPYVLKMHTENGLLDEVERKGVRRYEAEQQIYDFLAPYMVIKTKSMTPLAGNTISFDRTFLAAEMPRIDRMFHYRSIDVSSFNETFARWDPALHANRPRSSGTIHRAMDDILHSIETMRHYRTKMLGV